MRRMNFHLEMACIVGHVDKQANMSPTAGFVLNFKVEGGCENKLPLSELVVAQIRLLEVPDTTWPGSQKFKKSPTKQVH